MGEANQSLCWLKRKTRKEDTLTYLVQKINEPLQIIVLDTRHASHVLFPVQHVAELIVKPRWRPVEVTEFLQDWVTG